jgi:DNA adenine methylase
VSENTALLPPFAYFGGKTTLAPRIAAALPVHGHYVEPYCGSLAVLLAKPQSGMETVNDLDRSLMTFWRVLRERPAELARHCALTPHSIAEFRDAEGLEQAGGGDLETARRIWIRLTQGRAGTLCSTGWRHFVDPAGSGFGMPDYLDGYVARMAAAAERLHNVSLECRPAREVAEWYGRSADVLLYVDPPYLRSTRKSGAYRHEMTEADHRELAAVLHAAEASVVLSGYPSDLYDLDLYAGWHRTEFRSGTGQNARTWENRTEVLWSNRPFARPVTAEPDLASQLELFGPEDWVPARVPAGAA